MNRLGVGGNYVCYLVTVVIFIGLRERIKEVRGLKSLYGRKLKGGSDKVKGKARMGGGGTLFMGELTPQVFYQNYLTISASFDLKDQKTPRSQFQFARRRVPFLISGTTNFEMVFSVAI